MALDERGKQTALALLKKRHTPLEVAELMRCRTADVKLLLYPDPDVPMRRKNVVAKKIRKGDEGMIDLHAEHKAESEASKAAELWKARMGDQSWQNRGK